MSEPSTRPYRMSGVVKLGENTLELYCSCADAAQLLGISKQSVATMCQSLGKKRIGTHRITAADLYQMVAISKIMKEFECSATTATKFAAKLEEVKKS